MLTMTATVLNVFQAPEGTNRQGEKYGGESKVQLLGSMELRNGEKRQDLFTLSTKHPHLFASHLGKVVRVPVGVFASTKGLQFYLTNHGPELGD
jgi:hypothetical protein